MIRMRGFARLSRWWPPAGVALGLVMSLLAVPASAAPEPDRVVVSGTVPSWANGAKSAVPVDSGEQVTATVSLRLRPGAARFAAAVSDPRSPRYGDFLTPQEFQDRFAPSAGEAARVASWLQSAGLKVDVEPGNYVVRATGPADLVQRAFGTTLARFTVGGHLRRAPASPVMVPSAVAADVATVTGLSEVYVRAAHFAAPAEDNQLCSHYWGENNDLSVPQWEGHTQSNQICGYRGEQLHTMYDMGYSPNSGGNQTVAIVGAYSDPHQPSSTDLYNRRSGLTEFVAGQFSKVNLGNNTSHVRDCGGLRSWYEEEALDIEAVHTMAGGAQIRYVGAKDCSLDSVAAAFSRVLDAGKASIISNSYGQIETWVPPANRQQWAQLLIRAAAQGVTALFASGDDGNYTDYVWPPTSSWPASSKWALSVGGTAVGLDAEGTRQWDTGWSDTLYIDDKNAWLRIGFIGGAGGGASRVSPAPDWQHDVVSDGNSADHTRRASPDLAALADPFTGFRMGYNPGSGYHEETMGGTSLATPLAAGMLAIAQQRQGRHFGHVAPALYRTYAEAMHDVTRTKAAAYMPRVGLVNIDERPQTLSSNLGYDCLTGVGTPDGQNFLNNLAR